MSFLLLHLFIRSACDINEETFIINHRKLLLELKKKNKPLLNDREIISNNLYPCITLTKKATIINAILKAVATKGETVNFSNMLETLKSKGIRKDFKAFSES